MPEDFGSLYNHTTAEAEDDNDDFYFNCATLPP